MWLFEQRDSHLDHRTLQGRLCIPLESSYIHGVTGGLLTVKLSSRSPKTSGGPGLLGQTFVNLLEVSSFFFSGGSVGTIDTTQ